MSDSRGDPQKRAFSIGKWTFAALLPVSALAIGTLHASWLLAIALTAVVSSLLLWLDPPRETTRQSRLLMAALLVLVCITILQAIPLPAGLVRIIAPANADIWQRALLPLREAGPAWHPISI